MSYASGPFLIGGGYQIMRDTAAYYGVAVPVSDQKILEHSASTYKVGPATVYLGYTNNNVDNAGYKNQAGYLGLQYAFTSAWSLIALGTYDHLKHGDDSGNRFTGALMLDYAFSKRTDVYLEADYHEPDRRVAHPWRPATFQTPFYGHGSRVGVMAGLRHKF